VTRRQVGTEMHQGDGAPVETPVLFDGYPFYCAPRVKYVLKNGPSIVVSDCVFGRQYY
jgi:hypothetical protein